MLRFQRQYIMRTNLSLNKVWLKSLIKNIIYFSTTFSTERFLGALWKAFDGKCKFWGRELDLLSFEPTLTDSTVLPKPAFAFDFQKSNNWNQNSEKKEIVGPTPTQFPKCQILIFQRPRIRGTEIERRSGKKEKHFTECDKFRYYFQNICLQRRLRREPIFDLKIGA